MKKDKWSPLGLYVVISTLALIFVLGALAQQYGVNKSVRNDVVTALECEPVLVEKTCPKIPKLICDEVIECEECYPSVYYDEGCIVELEKLTERANEMEEKINAFNCESKVSINDSIPSVVLPDNIQSCMYTACMKDKKCCDY